MNKLILNKEQVNEIREASNGRGFYYTNSLNKATYFLSKGNRLHCFKNGEEGSKVTYAFESSFYLKDCIVEYKNYNGARIEYGAESWDSLNKILRECRHLWLDLKGEF